MKTRNKVNKHHQSYDLATDCALKAILEGLVVKNQGQVFDYDKDNNILEVRDFYGSSYYKPSFTKEGGVYPFKELVRTEVNNKGV